MIFGFSEAQAKEINPIKTNKTTLIIDLSTKMFSKRQLKLQSTINGFCYI